jgi:hypothetical protein
MTTYFRTTTTRAVGTSPTALLTVPGTSSYTIIGLNLANITDDDVTVTITVTDTTPKTVNYIQGLIIPPYSSAKVITNGERLILAGSFVLSMVSDTASSVDVTASYAEIV